MNINSILAFYRTRDYQDSGLSKSIILKSNYSPGTKMLKMSTWTKKRSQWLPWTMNGKIQQISKLYIYLFGNVWTSKHQSKEPKDRLLHSKYLHDYEIVRWDHDERNILCSLEELQFDNRRNPNLKTLSNFDWNNSDLNNGIESFL